jgi:anti-sigma factor ChrR (cupin superfamily)
MDIPNFAARLDLDGFAWRATRIPGVHWYPIFEGKEGEHEGDGSRDSVVLIRMEPGVGYPAHRHLGIEDVLILEGGYQDEFGVHRAGAFVRYPAGSVHSPIALADPPSSSHGRGRACVMFAIARGGVENLGRVTPDNQPRAP